MERYEDNNPTRSKLYGQKSIFQSYTGLFTPYIILDGYDLINRMNYISTYC